MFNMHVTHPPTWFPDYNFTDLSCLIPWYNNSVHRSDNNSVHRSDKKIVFIEVTKIVLLSIQFRDKSIVPGRSRANSSCAIGGGCLQHYFDNMKKQPRCRCFFFEHSHVV